MSSKKIILIFSFIVCLTNICAGETVKLMYYTTNGCIEKSIDSGIEELTFGKTSNVISVSGLEKLTNLKKVTFSMTAYITDFSFLNANPNIEIMILQDCTISDASFLYNQKRLRILALQGCKKIPKIRLTDLKLLEYLEISNSGIEELPIIAGDVILENLKIVNLAYNNIASLNPTILEYFKNCKIIMTGNPLILNKCNILYGSLFDTLPEEYHFLIR